MKGYYSRRLAAENLKRCYELSPPRIKQYLDSEISHVLNHLKTGDRVLELGCGYGRILPYLAKKASSVVGIDTSISSLAMGKQMLSLYPNILLIEMNALELEFEDDIFDVVVCIQNGISAFHVDRLKLIRESIRVTKHGGLILFSSYSEKIWNERLKWFELQASEELIGKIDYNKTKNGVIICEDGFSANTVNAEEFSELASEFKNIKTSITEVDCSSIFLEISPYKK